jgi:hypothetical protein
VVGIFDFCGIFVGIELLFINARGPIISKIDKQNPQTSLKTSVLVAVAGTLSRIDEHCR